MTTIMTNMNNLATKCPSNMESDIYKMILIKVTIPFSILKTIVGKHTWCVTHQAKHWISFGTIILKLLSWHWMDIFCCRMLKISTNSTLCFKFLPFLWSLALSCKRIPLNFKQGLNKSTSSLHRIWSSIREQQNYFFYPVKVLNVIWNVKEEKTWSILISYQR